MGVSLPLLGPAPPDRAASGGRRLSDALSAFSREELLRYVESLERRALHDPLTGVANRSLLQDRLGHAIALARRNRDTFAVLVCDLDGFKDVNDCYGHEVGDAVLRRVAQRLEAALRSSDSVARLGGDEFVVLLPSTDRAGAEVVAGKIRAAVGGPMRAGGRRITVGCSIGVSMFPEDAQDAAGLVRGADGRMYGAKGRRRARLARLTRVLALGAVFALGAIVASAGSIPVASPERPVPSGEDVPPAPVESEPTLGAPVPEPAGFPTARAVVFRSQAPVVVTTAPVPSAKGGSDEDDGIVRRILRRSSSPGTATSDDAGGSASDDDGDAKGKGGKGKGDDDDGSRGKGKGGKKEDD